MVGLDHYYKYRVLQKKIRFYEFEVMIVKGKKK